LDEAEYVEIKTHPELGHRILCGIRQFREILPGVLHHHESWDGKGYPHGLVGEEIPLIARIIAVADAFDAMASNRPYRAGMSIETVKTIFREGRGRQWDVNIVDALLADVPETLRNVYDCGLSADRFHPTRNSA
jgi:HD-GYP domain-containing protein (c-di-GMP phosphodiesterase class II)